MAERYLSGQLRIFAALAICFLVPVVLAAFAVPPVPMLALCLAAGATLAAVIWRETQPWSGGETGKLTPAEVGLAGSAATALPAIVYVVDADSLAVLFWNPACEAAFGKPATAVLGQPLAMVLPGDAGTFAAAKTTEANRAGDVVEVPAEIVDRDGERRYLRTWRRAFETPAGRRVVCLARDVTEERRPASAAPDAAAHRRREAFARAPVGMVLTTRQDGRIVDANAEILAVLGVTLPEITGRTTVDLGLLAGVDRRLLQEELARDGRSRPREGTITSPVDGRPHRFRWETALLGNADAEVLLTTIVDITAYGEEVDSAMQTATQFRQAFEHSGAAVFWADPKTGRLVNCNRAGAALVDREREDLLGAPQTILHPPEEAEHYREAFQRHAGYDEAACLDGEVMTRTGRRIPVAIVAGAFTTGSRRLAQAVMVDISERREVRHALRRQESLLENVADIVQTLSRTAGPAGVVLGVLGRLGEYFEQCRCVVWEHYGPPDGRRARRRHEWVRPGVAPGTPRDLDPRQLGTPDWFEALDRERIVQIRDARTDAVLAATDLAGLVLVPILVGDRCWGALGLESDIARAWSVGDLAAVRTVAAALGDAFGREVAEAAVREAQAETQAATRQLERAIERANQLAREDRAAGPPAAGGGRRILVVEDNAGNRRVIEHLVERLGDTATCVTDGAAALAILGEADFDVVLMDIQMPVMDGLTALGHIRDPNSPVRCHEVPVVIVTAHAMRGDRARFLAAGADDYLPKPVDPEDLATVLARVAPPPRPAAIDIDELRRHIDDGLIDELLDIYLEETPRQLQDLRDAIAEGRIEDAERFAHSVKGAAASIRAPGLRDAAAALELRLREGAGDVDCGAIEDAARAVVEEINRRRGGSGAARDRGPRPA